MAARPAKSEQRETRRDILDRALELFAEQGFNGTSMRDLARAVGVRESALYHHFPNKQALFLTLLTEFGPGSAAEMVGSLDFEKLIAQGPEVLLKTLVHRIADLWATPLQMKFARLIMTEAPRLARSGEFDPDVVLAQVVNTLGMLLAELSRRELIHLDDPVVAAQEFMGPMLLFRIRLMIAVAGEPRVAEFKAAAEKHVEFFLKAVRP